MYKSTSDSANFQRREGSHATKASARGVNLLGWELDESLSPEQQHRVLCSRYEWLTNQLMLHNAQRRTLLTKDQHAYILKELPALKARIRTVRPLPRKVSGHERCFMEVAHERLTKAEFDIWLAEAKRRAMALEATPQTEGQA